jgi:aryl-alcohol dehydrogenase-like predicted oxidoreductase
MMRETVTLGKSDLVVSALGVGTWQWGDATIWGFGAGYGRADVQAAYAASRAAGLTFYDTAEIYGSGTSETILGDLVRQEAGSVIVATKFAPLGRLSAAALAGALRASLTRLGLPRIDLYQVHWPYGFIRIEALMHAMADQVEAGHVRAVGVSNFSAPQLRRAHAALARRGIPLATNQVHYSLLHRHPERNGVLAACRELDVRLIAYSPLEQGLLTGKYHTANAPRVSAFRQLSSLRGAKVKASAPLIAALQRIGQSHDDRTPAQVALRWLIQQGALPIPGAKSAAQATANAGALGWELSELECEELSKISAAPGR